MYVGASPDSRLVSPWLGGQATTAVPASPWDGVAASPTPIRASGSSSSRYGRKTRVTTLSANKLQLSEDGDQNIEITESMSLEMEYNADRAW